MLAVLHNGGSSNINTISLPLIKNINAYAFVGCVNLSNFDFPFCENISYNAFTGVTSLRWIYISRCLNLGGSVLFDGVFIGISGRNITLIVPVELMTCNGGLPDGDIQYLQANNTVTIEVRYPD